MTWDEYALAWSGLHGGFDPRRASRVVRGWVLTAYRVGFWLSRHRVSPMTVTTCGLLICGAVPLAVPVSLPLAALFVLLAAGADGLDGAVAVISRRVTRLGFVYDSAADRLGEAAWLLAFWLAGAPGWLVVAGGAASWLHEYVRARAAVAGMSDIGVVTVGERPTRALIAGLGLAAITVVRLPWLPPALWLALQLAGLIQLGATVRRALR
ncbi:CDP-alcohol phosphatidyltransferase [Actinoplanes sp. SE50]|uniref:CDP-alcohol phosphatidyltransferase family protein n=1 Tax=unclassified Actinoplanes TaxID=2626549 RepID=UPI00023ECAA3|nr:MULTISPECIES: CDP-alcohol phosphatidyltransferase family protein [unclassified Actinoplanes]AEV82607.1 CDP-diacylglycerol-glycerol-3-phosphate 3-phosphatidyltransferase [Actinoplanes sp. SE50/110]ATO81003.1 CDP-alcohol phosphatidyltransferase [Actinoplanes sp. SE50]SLL98410.1 CDP-alcohol phosphatidyltransferase [Actinoplanes sp. SE50/110]